MRPQEIGNDVPTLFGSARNGVASAKFLQISTTRWVNQNLQSEEAVNKRTCPAPDCYWRQCNTSVRSVSYQFASLIPVRMAWHGAGFRSIIHSWKHAESLSHNTPTPLPALAEPLKLNFLRRSVINKFCAFGVKLIRRRCV